MAPQTIVDRLKQPAVSRDEVLEYLRHDAAFVRVGAFEAAARLAEIDDTLISVISKEVRRKENALRLLGTVTVAQVAVGCLLRIGTTRAKQAAQELMDEWPSNELDDLNWYLKLEGLA